jgi:transcriptional regulator with XRE-family HTH domain
MSELTLGQKIRQYRNRAKLTQLELELAIGTSQGSVSRIENDLINPTKETLSKIIDALDLYGEEAADLFGLATTTSWMDIFIKSTNKLSSDLVVDSILQTSVDDIVFNMKLFGAFVVMRKEDKLYAITNTRDPKVRFPLKFISKSFKELNASIDDKTNLMSKTYRENAVHSSKRLRDFIYPAVNMSTAIIIERVSGVKSCNSSPISVGGATKGVIMFGKDKVDDFEKEFVLLDLYTKYLGLAIGNAMIYANMKNL